MKYRVIFSPEFLEQLAELYRYIAAVASPNVAAQYTEAIVSHCESLHTFPQRGTQRGDIHFMEYETIMSKAHLSATN